MLVILHQRLRLKLPARQPYDVPITPSREIWASSLHACAVEEPLVTQRRPDLLPDYAQKLVTVAGETLLRPSRACPHEPRCRYRTNFKLERGEKSFLAGSCRRNVGDRHDGVVGRSFSGERLCRMEYGRRGLAGV